MVVFYERGTPVGIRNADLHTLGHSPAPLKGFPQLALPRVAEVGTEKQNVTPTLISQKVSITSFCNSQFPHIFVDVFLTLVIVKDKLADLWGS